MIGKYLCIDSLSHVTIYGKYKKKSRKSSTCVQISPLMCFAQYLKYTGAVRFHFPNSKMDFVQCYVHVIT